jgi:lauroyl/myristoyl acyltransferase
LEKKKDGADTIRRNGENGLENIFLCSHYDVVDLKFMVVNSYDGNILYLIANIQQSYAYSIKTWFNKEKMRMELAEDNDCNEA